MKFSIIVLLLVVMAATIVEAKKHMVYKKFAHRHRHAKRVLKKFEHSLKASTTSSTQA
jgi:hypothetical protein